MKHERAVAKNAKGKTLYIKLSIYRCGNADPTKNLTISCSDKATTFKTTLSDHGLDKFKAHVLALYKTHVLQNNTA